MKKIAMMLLMAAALAGCRTLRDGASGERTQIRTNSFGQLEAIKTTTP